MQVRVKENPEEIGRCGCGRSPTGKCIGWHGLTEDEWQGQKIQLLHNLKSNHSEITYVIKDDEQ
jgi:hypothetical protein